MRIYTVIILLLSFLIGNVCIAEPIELTTKKKLTPIGVMRFVVVREMNEEKSRIYLNKKLLIETEHSFSDTDFELTRRQDKSLRSRVLITEEVGPRCPTRYYILDFSGKEPIVSNAFENRHCSEFDWVSWGKKNAVVMLKDGSKFIYENGKVRSAK